MLSYQHGYHAGGPADVHKHLIFTLLLQKLTGKSKPASVIDLYAGSGTYRMDGGQSQKTAEYRAGIARLWEGKAPAPELASYLNIVRGLNPDGELRVYPGSPAIARHFLRPADRLILNELHPAAVRDLKHWAGYDARIGVHKRDGLEALVGLVPPAIRRGIVLIDPSYEMKADYGLLPDKLAKAVEKWSSGIFMVWYPLLADARHRPLVDSIAKIPAPSFLSELSLPARPQRALADGKKPSNGLTGTGVIVVNPPWRFDQDVTAAGAALASAMSDSGRGHTARWLRRDEAEAKSPSV